MCSWRSRYGLQLQKRSSGRLQSVKERALGRRQTVWASWHSSFRVAIRHAVWSTITDFLRAVRIHVDLGRERRLVLVGEGYYQTYQAEQGRLKAMAVELGLSERVRFAGKLPLDALVRTMQESAVLVLPSRAESLGMVLVESLACGTPVVATRCGGPEDIVDDRVGMLVPPDDPAALAAGIEQVLDRRDRYDRGALRAHALERFGLESVTARYAELYGEVLGRNEASA